jgi:hypothetical protein
METLNIIVLVGIFISAIVNLAIELEDKHTVKYELQLRILFCCVALGAIYPIIHKSKGDTLLLHSVVFFFLITRIITRLRQLHKKHF